jgi:RNA polymerase sigma-70 factor (ECF subfamily)
MHAAMRPPRESESRVALPAEPDDAALALRASQGDEAALEQLVAAHAATLRAFLAYRAGAALRARESASDLAQSVVRELYAHLRDGRFEYQGPAELRQWLFRAGELKLRERRRHWARDRRDAQREVAVDALTSAVRDARLVDVHADATPSREVGAHEELARVRSALDSLPARYREVIELARVRGLDHAEIARKLAIHEAASRQLLSRALARLATLLRQGGASGEARTAPATEQRT